jgi:glycosyltransferase involved in cell wall biosynthesis
LSAIISWGIYNKDKPLAIHNFHNFAMPNLQCDIFGYYIDTLVERYSKESVSVSHEASLSLKIRKAFKSAMNISFVYNGVAIDSAGHTSPDEFSNIWKDLGICQSKKVCICLGTYEKRKGQPFILDVFKHVVSRFPEVVLIFAGHGSVLEKKSLRFYADQLGLNGNVYFMDFVSNVSFLFDMADLCLIGSQEYESFGLTSIEAMLYSVPVVSTNTGGLKEVILDGVGGFLFDKTDVTGFSNKVLELLNSDDYCVSQGKMGNERVNQIFSIDKMVCSYYSKLQ